MRHYYSGNAKVGVEEKCSAGFTRSPLFPRSGRPISYTLRLLCSRRKCFRTMVTRTVLMRTLLSLEAGRITVRAGAVKSKEKHWSLGDLNQSVTELEWLVLDSGHFCEAG